jgi:ammonium transporter, Amt family
LSGLDFTEHGSNAYELKDTVLESNAAPSPFGTDLVERLNSIGTGNVSNVDQRNTI